MDLKNILATPAQTIGKIMAIMAVLAAIGGCALHRSGVEADLPTVPASFQYRLEGSAAPVDRWWTLFEDAQLDALMDEAFGNNLTLQEAYARWNRFLAEYIIVGSQRKPFINLGGAAGRQRGPSAFGATTENQFELSGVAGYEVDLWGRLRSQSQAALWEVLATEQDIQALYISLAAQIADLYYLTVEQKNQLVLIDKIVESYQEALNLTEEKYKYGLVSALDVAQAEQSLADIRALQPDFEEQLAVSEHALSVLIGRYPQIGVSGSRDELPQAPPSLPVALPSTVLKQRPDIQAAIMRLKAADARVAAAVADRFPRIDLSATIGYASTSLNTLFDPVSFIWSIVGEITQPAFDAGLRRAEVERRKAIYQEGVSQFGNSVLTAFRDVDDALVRNRESGNKVKRVEELVNVSARALELSEERYAQGVQDYLPVLTAQQQYYSARRELLSAQRRLLSSRIELSRALGGSWPDALVKDRLTGLENSGEPSGPGGTVQMTGAAPRQ